MNEYFKGLSKQKLISKATYSILYHPMLKLTKTYTIEIDGSVKDIKITSDHVFLLCYLMGYVQDKCGADSYYGSNKTLSNDLGVSVRTIQRRLSALAEVGFIMTSIDDSSYRHIYINFEKIMLEISKVLKLKYDFDMVFRFCHGTALCFASKNLLEKAQILEYTSYLRIQYLLEVSRNPVKEPIRFLFARLAECLKLDFTSVEEECEKARLSYIKTGNEKSLIMIKE